MRYFLVIFLSLASTHIPAAMPKLVFDQVPIGDLIRIYYSDIEKRAF